MEFPQLSTPFGYMRVHTVSIEDWCPFATIKVLTLNTIENMYKEFVIGRVYLCSYLKETNKTKQYSLNEASIRILLNERNSNNRGIGCLCWWF